MGSLKVSLSLFLLHLLCCVVLYTLPVAGEEGTEEFNEELLLRPLPDRKVLAHFHFETRAHNSSNGSHHHRLFPKSISQLAHKFHIREMELSFTQGRWNYERWGGIDPISNKNAKPPGVELWAVFDVPPSQVDTTWKNLVHALSGLFCASINFLESSTSYSTPEWGSRTFSGSLRYGTLPREAVCTENLTPWLKLLPCRDKAGISELMDRPSIYRGFFHSQRLRLISSESNPFKIGSEIRLEQTLTIVLQPRGQRVSTSSVRDSTRQPSWSMSSIFGKNVNGRCVLAKSSNVYLQLDRGLVPKLKSFSQNNDDLMPDQTAVDIASLSPEFEFSDTPDKVIQESSSLNSEEFSVLYLFLLEKHVVDKPFDFALTWKLPVVWSCPQAPLRANRFLMGSGNERGAIAISLKPTENTNGLLGSGLLKEDCKLEVEIFQVVPWYVKVYYHTLNVYVDGKIQPSADVTEKICVSPSEDKVSPGVLELLLKLPCGMKSAVLTVEFDKGFLHIDEYPPDANQGFDIPSAVISFPGFKSNSYFNENFSDSPLMLRLQEECLALAYTEVLLVPLTTPDFSMPYNVITITCTVFALYFGSVLNVLRRRAGEEERRLKDKGSKKGGWIQQLYYKLSAKLRRVPYEPPQLEQKSTQSTRSKLLVKAILLATVAVAWQYFSG